MPKPDNTYFDLIWKTKQMTYTFGTVAVFLYSFARREVHDILGRFLGLKHDRGSCVQLGWFCRIARGIGASLRHTIGHICIESSLRWWRHGEINGRQRIIIDGVHCYFVIGIRRRHFTIDYVIWRHFCINCRKPCDNELQVQHTQITTIINEWYGNW